MASSVPRPSGPLAPPNRVRVFDTTLRDGEQAPGAGLTAAEKLEVARQLVRLKVDVIEVGFPAASDGDFEAVRLLVLSLLRSGKVEATSKGQTIESTTGVAARDTFSNNNVFRQAAFRPRKSPDFAEQVKASDAFRETFGREIKDISNPVTIVAPYRSLNSSNREPSTSRAMISRTS